LLLKNFAKTLSVTLPQQPQACRTASRRVRNLYFCTRNKAVEPAQFVHFARKSGMRNRFQFFRAKRFQASKILTHGDVALRGYTPALRLYGKVGNMNGLPSTMKWLGLGLGVYSLATLACSAEASSPPIREGNGSQAGNGSGGTPSIGTAGSTALPTAGTTATGPQGGSTSVGTAGSTAVGTAGTPAGTGGMMGGSLTACPAPPAAGAITDLLIDDLEDGDNGVARVGNRTGYWYTYLDALASTIIPTPDATGTSPLKPGTTNCHGASKACIMISGITAAADEVAKKYPYAGVGFDFSNAKKPCVYNASAYAGIKFWARGDVPITIKLNTSATAKPDGGGTCTGDLCNGGFSPAGADVVLTAEWQQIDINFATAAPPAWAAALAMHPDKANLVSLQVQIPPGQTYSIALDDFTFY
jgi:hypothetical protein